MTADPAGTGTAVLEATDADQLFALAEVLSELPPAPDEELDRYLDATSRCLARYGLTHTTVPDVAAEAGVSRSTIYRAVGSMDELVPLLVLRDVHRFLDHLPQRVVGRSGVDALVDVTAGLVVAAREHPLLRTDLAAHPEEVAAALSRYFPDIIGDTSRLVAPLLRAAMQLGYLAERDADVVADWAARIVLSLLLTPHPGDLRAYLAEVLRPTLALPGPR